MEFIPNVNATVPGNMAWFCMVAAAFAIGCLVNRWLDGGRQRQSEIASSTALGLLRDVFHRTDDISRELVEYRELLAGLAKRVKTSDETESSAELLTRFMKLNHVLQQRLEESERALREQTAQLAVYISQARVDAHSGLHNRRSFDEELERQVAYWRRNRHPFSLIMIDIDHFKSINDQYGHQAGDLVIRTIGDSLKQTLRTSDFVARFGGEEFAVLLRGSDLEMASRAAERCCEAIRECEVVHLGRTIQVTGSCGAATVTECDDGPMLLKRADDALYQAKANGRNTVVAHGGTEFRVCHPLECVALGGLG